MAKYVIEFIGIIALWILTSEARYYFSSRAFGVPGMKLAGRQLWSARQFFVYNPTIIIRLILVVAALLLLVDMATHYTS